MRVLVIGGTSFIGPHVVTQLHEQGHEVTLYHRGRHEAELPAAIRHIHSARAGIPVLHFPAILSDPPPEVPFEEASTSLSPMALSFWQECRRMRNDRLKRELGVSLLYPTYREGLHALFAAR